MDHARGEYELGAVSLWGGVVGGLGLELDELGFAVIIVSNFFLCVLYCTVSRQYSVNSKFLHSPHPWFLAVWRSREYWLCSSRYLESRCDYCAL